MAARLGNVLYWTCTSIAFLFMGGAIFVQFSRPVSIPFPYFWYVFRAEYLEYTINERILTIVAALIYLFGRAVRYILAGK